jgi:acetyl-CoA C-acetyltransferase
MARRRLGLGAKITPTVTGGLTFFGAPLNAYMAHAACAMVRHLRDGGRLGLLYGQGGYLTRHHALVLGAQPPEAPLAQAISAQAAADATRGKAPAIVAEAVGEGCVETFTVLYDRAGVRHGVVVLRTEDGARTLAKVAPDDRATLARLMEMERSPVGVRGPIGRNDDGLLHWRVAA